MKVAIDSSALLKGHNVRGIGKYTKNLIEGLEKISKVQKDFLLDKFDFASNPEKLSEFDIIHYPYFDLFFKTLSINKPTKTVVTVHDVIPLLYPKYYPPGFRGKIKFLIQKFSLQSVKAVITDTETSKKDIVRLLGVKDKNVTAIHLAPGNKIDSVSNKVLKEVREKYKLPKEFVLYVGDINYNKNILSLAKACRRMKVGLVIVGKQAVEIDNQLFESQTSGGIRDKIRYVFGQTHPELKHYLKLKKLFAKGGIWRLGYLEGDEFNAIWQMAIIYCQPSFYEGFGLPVVESMQAGVPVIAAKTQALVEIAGDSAFFVEDLTSEGFAKSIKRLLDDKKLREKLIQSGYNKVKEYYWEKTAKETYEVYKKVYKGI